MKLSQNPSDYTIWKQPTTKVSIEALADSWAIAGPYADQSRISWYALQTLAADPENKLAVLDGLGWHRVGHSLVDAWKKIGLTKLERRIAGRVVEHLAWLEDVRDDIVTAEDARIEWERQAQSEPEWRREAFGQITEHDDELFELLARLAHQCWSGVKAIGTPMQFHEDEEHSGWSHRVDAGRIAGNAGTGIVDAIVFGAQTSVPVLVDVKCTEHSIRRGEPLWNPKNQVQLIGYLVAIAAELVMRPSDYITTSPMPVAVAFVNPLNGTIEWMTSECLLGHMDVIRRVAESGLGIHGDDLERVMGFIAERLRNAI